ncbi:BatA domain-containing protein [Winogradskyella sp. A3E31]|uniref:BatA domain-containing protein n=1 Tax=Winogradskyella sp. A3E31 TaxID=3349637 RepID=UPI00398B343D
MQFKHPELLWALLLLVIPIIIHLFQLRRFQKIDFTNVKFLENVVQQTRKSSQIKKWLILFTRLFLLACVILAFAQPYTSDKTDFKTASETVIYIDNSHSMGAQGSNGTLLNEAIQALLTHISQEEPITIFTNDEVFKDTNIKAISNQLIGLGFSPNQLSYEAAYLKGTNYFSNDDSTLKNFVMVSDFQQASDMLDFEEDSGINLKIVQSNPVNVANISIDSVFIDTVSPDNLELSVKLSKTGSTNNSASVALYNGSELLAKSAVDFNTSDITNFTLPTNTPIDGMVSIEDSGLEYDNTFYFNINSEEKIKVLSINNTDDEFLSRIYTDDEFLYTSTSINTLNYNIVSEQNLIVLNELESIPNPLITNLQTFKSNGGSILIIPSIEIIFNSYNQLLTTLNSTTYTGLNDIEKKVTTIQFNHPVLANAFYNRVTNFQYPKANTSYGMSSSSNAIYAFEDGSPFLTGRDKVYVFTGSLNNDNSNFKSSPLIVPALYNIGKQSLELPQLYYTIGNLNTIDIKTDLGQDDILMLRTDGASTIPLQQTYSNKVSLTLNDFPKASGIIDVVDKQEVLKKLSFNYNRSESDLNYHNMSLNADYSLSSSLSSAIEDIKSGTNVNELWKWFVIFAVIFLITEKLILKYLK